MFYKLLDLHRILAVIELFLRQKRSVSRMVQNFKTLEYLCSDVSALLSGIRSSVHMLSHRAAAHSETDLSLTRAEIGSLCVRLKEYTGLFSETLATIINMHSPVSYYESYVTDQLVLLIYIRMLIEIQRACITNKPQNSEHLINPKSSAI